MKKKREENVELSDIQAVRERMTQWAIRLWLLLIPVIVGIILSAQGESTAREGNFIVRIAFLLIDGCGLCGVSSEFGKKILGKVPANPPDGQSAD